MATKKDMTVLFSTVIGHIRNNYPSELDRAYDYFWEEDYPEDYLQGIALDIGFINFEDWLVCDYRLSDGRTFIDIYIEDCKGLSGEELKLLGKMKDSVISLYVVKAISPGVVFNDLLFGQEVRMGKGASEKGYKVGDVFAARLLKPGRAYIMSGCIYPYGKTKDKVLGYVQRHFDRYRKNERPDGTMRDFLKRYSDVFNTIWVSLLQGNKAMIF